MADKDEIIRARVSQTLKERLRRFSEHDANERDESVIIREAVVEYLTREERALRRSNSTVDQAAVRLATKGLPKTKKPKRKKQGWPPTGSASGSTPTAPSD